MAAGRSSAISCTRSGASGDHTTRIGGAAGPSSTQAVRFGAGTSARNRANTSAWAVSWGDALSRRELGLRDPDILGEFGALNEEDAVSS